MEGKFPEFDEMTSRIGKCNTAGKLQYSLLEVLVLCKTHIT